MNISTAMILAIDLGNYKSVCCWYEPLTKKASYQTVETTPEEIEDVILSQADLTVVIEACSPAGWVADLCESCSVRVLVANTNADAWAWKNVKRKTDKDDALKLARLASLGELPIVRIPPKTTRQRKSLIGLRKRLVGERVRGQNRIRGLLVGQGLTAPRGASAWTELGLQGLSQLAKPLSECFPEELWQGELYLLIERYRSTVEQIATIERKLDELAKTDEATQLLLTVPGVGVRTAEVIATGLGDVKRFDSAEQVSAYAGLVPKQYQSGETDRRGRITKRGSRVLRSALVECAWCSLRYNGWSREVWERLQKNGLSKKKAVVALARKLLVRCWGMLKHKQVWQVELKEQAKPLSS